MESNFWFYTLSAIPQTLAAMIALAATFVIFKLNFIQEKIQYHRKDLRRFILLLTSYENKEIHDIEPLSDEDFLKLYNKSLRNIKTDKSYLGLNEGIYRRLELELDRIIVDDWKSSYKADPNRVNGYLNAKRTILESLLFKKQNSLRLLALSLFTTAFVIVVSLITLPNYRNSSSSLSVINIILLGALISIVLTTASVWEIARD